MCFGGGGGGGGGISNLLPPNSGKKNDCWPDKLITIIVFIFCFYSNGDNNKS